jgi:hypothetical protein
LVGPSGLFCWIVSNSNSKAADIATIVYYSLTWFIILLNCFFVIRVISMLKKELISEGDLVKKYTNKLKLYPLVQIISFLPATVNKVYNLTTNRENFYMLLLQGMFDAMTGLMFALVFGFNLSVRNYISECCRIICCCRKKEKLDSDAINIGVDKSRTKSFNYLDDTILTDS